MPRKKKPVDDSDLLQLGAFAKQVETALLRFGDSAWLGKNSPLAQPWVLGAQLAGRGGGDVERGELLRELIREAAATLTDDDERSVVQQGYIQRDPYLTNAGVALRLYMNERQFFRKRASAVRQMAVWLYRRLISPLRLESPPLQAMAGRHRERALIQTSLEPGKSVFVAGPSGIGKSTLAAEVIHDRTAAHFWYTVRPGFNDNLESFLFALAWFLREQGAHNLWLQIVADNRGLDSERIAGLLRYDLSALPAGGYVICIDEIDLLNADDPEHARMLHAIDIMRPIAPLLFLGQRALLESTTLLKLGALPEEELREWHATLEQELQTPFATLQKLTQGIPVLLTAWLILARSDPAYAALIDDSRPITLESIFQRVWRKLPAEERLLIAEIAIHGGAVPTEMLLVGEATSGGERMALDGLLARALVFAPTSTSVQLPEYLVNLVQQHLDQETRTLLHLRVAQRLEERGQNVEALHHWIAGGRAELGIWLWFRHRRVEINRGNATRALAMLTSITPQHLPREKDRTALQISLAELQIHLGQPDAARESVTPEAGDISPSTHAHLAFLRAQVDSMEGNHERALNLYRESLDTLIGTFAEREADLRWKLTHVYLNNGIQMEEARMQSLIFRFRAEATHGSVEELLGNYDVAEERFAAALALADEIPQSTVERANILLETSSLRIVQGKYAEAETILLEAIACFEEVGALHNELVSKSNLAYNWVRAGKSNAALALLEGAIPKARRMRNGYLLSGLACAASEAHLAKGQREEAEQYAIEAVQQEDEFNQHWALTQYALVRSQQGAHEDARLLALQGLESARELGNPFSIGYCERQLGVVRQSAGALDEAREWFMQARATYAKVGLDNEVQEIDALLVDAV